MNTFDPDKELVVQHRPDSWAFRVPRGNTAELRENPDGCVLILSAGTLSAAYGVVEIIDQQDEVRVVIAHNSIDGAVGPGGRGPNVPAAATGYSFPSIDVELARLEADYVAGGGHFTKPKAWAQGASWDSHTRWLRQEIRRLQSSAQAG